MQRFARQFLDILAALLVTNGIRRCGEVAKGPDMLAQNVFRNRGNSCSSTRELVPFNQVIWLIRCVGRYETNTWTWSPPPPADDLQLMLGAHASYYVSRTHCHLSVQHRLPILRNPDDMHLQVHLRVRSNR